MLRLRLRVRVQVLGFYMISTVDSNKFKKMGIVIIRVFISLHIKAA